MLYCKKSDCWGDTMLKDLPPWEQLLKKILWEQIGDLAGKQILDFGSGNGVTACHYARDNDVTAVEPNEEYAANRERENPYLQLTGSTQVLKEMPGSSFDVVFCHNVLEYAPDREDIVKELCRVLKPGGILSVVKHNRAGRVMQMMVLLDDFERANALLDGKDSVSSQFGAIRYYEDSDICGWCGALAVEQVHGIRTFWDLQQNQQRHSDPLWQEKMVRMEMRVSDLDEFRNVAFFHHLILRKVFEW